MYYSHTTVVLQLHYINFFDAYCKYQFRFVCNNCIVLIRFAEPDSEDNIMFNQKELRNTNIKGWTLLKLVERLTYHEESGEYAIKSKELKTKQYSTSENL